MPRRRLAFNHSAALTRVLKRLPKHAGPQAEVDDLETIADSGERGGDRRDWKGVGVHRDFFHGDVERCLIWNIKNPPFSISTVPPTTVLFPCLTIILTVQYIPEYLNRIE